VCETKKRGKREKILYDKLRKRWLGFSEQISFIIWQLTACHETLNTEHKTIHVIIN